MAREVIVKTWCDPCLAEEKHNEGAELPPLALIPGRKPRVVALCEVHRKELYDPLHDLLAEHGQPVDEEGNPTPGTRGHYKRREPEGEFPCPVQGCGYMGGTKTRLQSHARQVHESTLAELAGEPTPYDCPEPGCGKSFSTPQGMAVHRTRGHAAEDAAAQ